jgi:hypothetical protein
MSPHRPARLLCAALLAFAFARGDEQNAWPLAVHQTPPDTSAVVTESYFGPLGFVRQSATGTVQGFRPLWLEAQAGDKQTATFLYPLFTWQRQPGYREFSFFQLVNFRHEAESEPAAVKRLDVWPFYFSRESADPAETYHALFPLAGTIRQRFGKDRLTWYAFPLYFNTDKGGMQVTSAPWPFIRVIAGAGHHGFEFWPLFGRRGREGDYDKQFYLWPLIYKSARDLSAPEPTVSLGFLPFYTRDTAPGYRNENYLWPFFGYSHRTEPFHYHETRYLWPFLVQGRGDQRYVNRWGPLYTHSVIKGYDKTWILWPLIRHATWEEQGVAQEKEQFLLFVYWSLTQRSLTNPAAAPAHKTHLWPLYSSWDNGAGRRQVQVLSPLEVFFPTNEIIRQLYTPLFALYRYDQPDPSTARHSLLWHAVTWRRSPEGRTFHLGPLLGVETGPQRQRIALGRGLIGLQRQPGERLWRLFLFDFPRKPANTAPEGTPSP